MLLCYLIMFYYCFYYMLYYYVILYVIYVTGEAADAVHSASAAVWSLREGAVYWYPVP